MYMVPYNTWIIGMNNECHLWKHVLGISYSLVIELWYVKAWTDLVFTRCMGGLHLVRTHIFRDNRPPCTHFTQPISTVVCKNYSYLWHPLPLSAYVLNGSPLLTINSFLHAQTQSYSLIWDRERCGWVRGWIARIPFPSRRNDRSCSRKQN